MCEQWEGVNVFLRRLLPCPSPLDGFRLIPLACLMYGPTRRTCPYYTSLRTRNGMPTYLWSPPPRRVVVAHLYGGRHEGRELAWASDESRPIRRPDATS